MSHVNSAPIRQHAHSALVNSLPKALNASHHAMMDTTITIKCALNAQVDARPAQVPLPAHHAMLPSSSARLNHAAQDALLDST